MLRDHLDLAVFDIAGTTLAVADEVPAALDGAFAEAGVSVPSDAITAVRGRSKSEAIRLLVDRYAPGSAEPDVLGARILGRFRELLRARLAGGARPVAGAESTLQWLRDQGVARVLTTGFDRELARSLMEQVGWRAPLIDGVVAAEDVTHGRPDPELVYRAMEIVGCGDAGRVAVIGDTTADLDTGRAAGACCTIGVLTGAHDRAALEGHPHTAILASVAELPAWLEAWSRRRT